MSGRVYLTGIVCIFYLATTVVILPKDGVKAALVKREIVVSCDKLCKNCNAVGQVKDGTCVCRSDNVNDAVCLDTQVYKANLMGFILETAWDNVTNGLQMKLTETDGRNSTGISHLRSRRCLGGTIGTKRKPLAPKKTPQEIRDELKYRIETIRNLAFLGQLQANEKESVVEAPLQIEKIIAPINKIMEPIKEVVEPAVKMIMEPIKGVMSPLRNKLLSSSGSPVENSLEDTEPAVNMSSDVVSPAVEGATDMLPANFGNVAGNLVKI